MPPRRSSGHGNNTGHGNTNNSSNSRRLRVDYPRRGRRGLLRLVPSWRQLLALSLLCCGAVAALVGYVYSTVHIADVNAAARAEANVYYWADGTHMVTVGAVNRQNIPLSDIPPSLQNAVIAAENADFYSDPGFSVGGVGRAVVNMARGGQVQGGSTITQQYVKNTYLTPEQTVDRKLRELCLAVKLSRSLSKQEILQGYLNTSWFGRNAYGVQAAAVAYYGMDAKDLDPGRSALLAALLKGAEQYDPSLSEANHRRAEARWRYVLDRQVELGHMTREERARYTVFPEPRPQSVSPGLSGQTGYLVDVANKYIQKRTGLTAEELGRGGYRIRTTFDKTGVERLRRSVEQVTARALDPGNRAADRDVQVGAASVRPSDGAVLALYGGPDATEHFTNNADTAGVPVGSAFKPFVLAAALQHGVRSAGAAPPRLPVTSDSFYDPTGALTAATPLLARGGESRFGDGVLPFATGLPTLREALVRGGDSVYSRLGEDVGLAKVRDLAVSTGLLPQSMAPLERRFSVGTSTPSAIRMADAYATFAEEGRRTDPYSVTAVTYRGARLEGLEPPPGRQVLDTAVAREVSRAMRDVAVDALAPDTLRALGPVAAGRTGDDDRLPAAWFVGYTEELSTAVTVFRDKPGRGGLLPLTGLGGAAGPGASAETRDFLPLRVWSSYMTAASEAPAPAQETDFRASADSP
ncbi:penicillin-binding protein [Streptomyces agglomeratus]|uniref:Penicillin-binding protein n=1 Tax=Streptomyces agglomeratus TaxID=285458 RepID=A0A1E5PFT9_9ACTN|nr:transglycosylase domain-containing protein [Streptomyces agglomeratus]OEJ28418.1 penicillin-binding protein [Streptomyces agglomeratus]OEJ37519.1 penicillin-binding protein [Streptomyces agglomeratus]OEJ48096.1 penicillin-binding protein [Streptomyces agglomeratus]OEJ50060.1 penicillin-binding protein [Streptomyces agglomeratus]